MVKALAFDVIGRLVMCAYDFAETLNASNMMIPSFFMGDFAASIHQVARVAKSFYQAGLDDLEEAKALEL